MPVLDLDFRLRIEQFLSYKRFDQLNPDIHDKIETYLPVSFKFMLKRSPFDSHQIMRRTEDLIQAASNRYRITVQVANRAQRRRFEDFENYEDPKMKPVLRAIIEMSDELTQPEIIGE